MISNMVSEQILTEARQVQFSRVMFTLVLAPFWALGWLAGHVWLGLVIAAISVRRGWRDGTGYVSPPEPPQSR